MTRQEGISRRSFLSRGAAAGGAVVLAGATGSALAGCSSSGGAPAATAPGSKPGVGTGSPVRGGSLTFGTVAEIDGFYPPANHWDTNGFLYANAIYDPLMYIAADGSIQPYLAQSLTPNATFDVWTLTLRHGIKFNDGSDLTAAVIVANTDALRTSALTSIPLEIISGVEATDDLTVVFTLTGPAARFSAALADTQAAYPVGQAMIDQANAGNKTPTPVGTGPFVYDNWQPNDHFTATRNPHYWQAGLPYLDQITFKPIPDTTQREATLSTDGVDMILSTDPGTIKRWTGKAGYQLVDSRTGIIGEPTLGFIMLNTAVSPLDDLRVRQALAKATNQAEVQTIFDFGYGRPVNGLFLPGSQYYSATGYPTYDLAGAKALVAEYKAEHGTPTIELQTATDPLLTKIVQVIQQMWMEAGFDVTLATLEEAVLLDNFIFGTYQTGTIYLFGTVDPDLNYWWFSSNTAGPVGSVALNFARNKDPQIDAAIATGRASNDPATRIAAYQTLNKRLAQDLPYIWLSQYFFSEVAASRVQNFDNLVLPDGMPGYSFNEGVMFVTQTWLAG